jgi:pyrimidine-nucleoside phosphorylase
MVHLAQAAATLDEARQRVTKALRSGEGIERLRRIIECQGGDPRCVDDYQLLPMAAKSLAVKAERGGYITAMLAETIGLAAMRLGAGRNRAEDAVDHGVGFRFRVVAGAQVKAGDTIAEVFGRDDAKMHEAAAEVRAACRICDAPPAPQALIWEEIL